MGKKVLSILLALVICFGLLPSVSIQTHAEEDAMDMSDWVTGGRPAQTNKSLTINDEYDFKLFQLELCKWGRTFEGYTITLTADLDLNPEWNSPVTLDWYTENAPAGSGETYKKGDLKNAVQEATAPAYAMPSIDEANNEAKAKQFGGVFEGQGHTISGLYLSLNAGNAASIFGKVIGTAEVRDLVVLDSYFANGKAEAGTKPLAGLFAEIPTGTTATISNCYVDIDLYMKSTVKSSGSNTTAKFGGLVGYCKGTLTIENTVYAGCMSFNPDGTAKRLDDVGGFIGLVEGANAGAANVTIRNSVFSGKIWSPYQRVGGGIGRSQNRANTTMTNCLILGDVYASSNSAGLHASILITGDSVVQNVTIVDCYSNKAISRFVYPAGTHNGNCTVTASLNGVVKYQIGSSSVADFKIDPADFTGFAAQAILESMPIGGDTGKMSDAFAATEGTVVPKAFYDLYSPTAPVITTNPTDKAYDKDDVAAALSVAATGEGTLTYQWYCDGVAIDGATNATYTPSTATSGNFAYHCVVTANDTNFLGNVIATATSTAATVHVHDWTPGTCTEPKHCNIAECPTVVEAPDHTFDDDCTTDDQCAFCPEKAPANESHTFDTDCTTADQCAYCKQLTTANEKHSYDDDHDTDCNVEGCTVIRDAVHTEATEWSSDETKHWHACTGCDEYAFAVNLHADSETDEDVLCDVCGYDMTCRHTDLKYVKGVAPTCTEDGLEGYYVCNGCGVRLSEKLDGTILEDEIPVIPAQHMGISKKYYSNKTDHWKVCDDCDAKLYVSAHTYSNAKDTRCDCGHKRNIVPLEEMITVTKWLEAGCPEVVKHVTITNVDDFKAFMKVLKEKTTAVLNSSWQIKEEGDIAFDGVTIYLTADLDLNPGWTNNFSLNWNDEGRLRGNQKVKVPGTKYNVYPHRVFGGMFEGMGHTITGLYIDQQKSAAAQSLLGVAHSTSGFTVGVQNLKIKNSYIEGTNAGMGSLFTGVTAGTNVLISNCNIDVDLVSRIKIEDKDKDKEKKSAYVGGLIGVSAGNVTIKSTTYSGNIWVENTQNKDFREVGGAIGSIKGGSTVKAENHVILNKFTFRGKIFCLNGQRVGLFAGRIDNQINVTFVDSVSRGSLVLLNGMYAGGLCNNIVAAAEGVSTKVFIDNCYYIPGSILNEGKLEEQTQIFTALHAGSTEVMYGGYGKIIKTGAAKGNCVIYVVSDRGTNWNENLCLYDGSYNPATGDKAGMNMGYVVAVMLLSFMALVVLISKKYIHK